MVSMLRVPVDRPAIHHPPGRQPGQRLGYQPRMGVRPRASPAAATFKPRTTLQTAARALAFLKYVAECAQPPQLKEVAAALEINITICYHPRCVIWQLFRLAVDSPSSAKSGVPSRCLNFADDWASLSQFLSHSSSSGRVRCLPPTALLSTRRTSTPVPEPWFAELESV